MKKLLLAFFLIVAAAPAFADASSLTIGSIIGTQGQTINIPVTADIATGIIADQFDVQFDPALLTFSGITVGSSNAAWTIISNSATSGKIRIGMYNTATIVGNSQQIALLKFIVNWSSTPTLTSPNLILSNVYFNESSITTLNNGNFTSKILGDVDGNGKIEAADATLVAQYAIELATLTTVQLQAADVSGNGTVSFYDASLIAQYVKGIITKFR